MNLADDATANSQTACFNGLQRKTNCCPNGALQASLRDAGIFAAPARGLKPTAKFRSSLRDCKRREHHFLPRLFLLPDVLRKWVAKWLTLHREIGDRRGEGTDLGNLGVAYRNLGEPRRAIEFYEQALMIARETGDWLGEYNALVGQQEAWGQLGDLTQALECCLAAIMIFGESESPDADLMDMALVKLLQ